MNKWRLLMCENSKERPRDRDRGREVTFWRRECVCCCGGLKEESYGKELIVLQEGGDEKPYSARKTKTLVQMPGCSFKALAPKASNAVSMTRIVVQPW
jgi:hypothetical protein